MAQVHEQIDDSLAAWIRAQPMWFVATAPLGANGHVNVSPRGLDSFSVLAPDRVAWADYTGSGSETIAHLRENGRVCLMFCAFDQRPRVLRLHGTGTVRLPGDPEFERVVALHPPHPGVRAVIDVTVTRVVTSCGYAVPRMDLVGQRDLLRLWSEKKGPAGLTAYQAERNAVSIDGLPALPAPPTVLSPVAATGPAPAAPPDHV